MFTVPKALTLIAAAILSTSPAFAQDSETVSFRYVRSASVEANYAAFRTTAQRACADLSNLITLTARMECQKSLIAQAVSASRIEDLIALHAKRTGTVHEVASLARR